MQNLERGEKRMFRIAICDDEKIFRDDLKEILIRYMTDRGIMLEIDTFSSGKEFVELGIEMVKYKIVFLDINMDELDGIMTAKKIRENSKDMFIVFVTAFVNYTIEGYLVSFYYDSGCSDFYFYGSDDVVIFQKSQPGYPLGHFGICSRNNDLYRFYETDARFDQHPILPIVLCSDENHQYGLVFCRYRFVVSFRISGEVVEEKRGGTLRRFTSILPAGSDIGASDDYRP